MIDYRLNNMKKGSDTMKKIISLLCCVSLILSCCMIPVRASNDITFVTPEITSIDYSGDNIDIGWSYTGTGQSAFELQYSEDNGETWNYCCQANADVRTASIPVIGDEESYLYRVAPIGADNGSVYFSAARSLKEREPYARYTFDEATNLGKDLKGNYPLENGDNNAIDGYEVSAATVDGRTTGYFAATDWETSLRNFNASYLDSLDGFTISVTAKAELSMPDSGGLGALVSTGWDNCGGFSFGINKGKQIWFDAIQSDGTVVWITANSGVESINDFHEYTLSVSNAKKVVKIYCDGKLVHIKTLTEPLRLTNTHSDAFNRLVVGQIWWQGGYKFKGWMDSISIYNDTLSDTEVSYLHKVGTAINPSNERPILLSKYSFEDAEDLGMDSIGGVHLDQNGTGITQVEGAYGRAAKFDGTANMRADVSDFQDLADYTVMFFAQFHETDLNRWPTVVQNGAKLRIFLRPDNYIIVQNEEAAWLAYCDLNPKGIKVSDMHHYAVSISIEDNTIAVYVDGILVVKTKTADRLSASNKWHVFSLGGVSDICDYKDRSASVTLDEVNIYEGVLSAKQIGNLYKSYTEDEYVPEMDTPDAFYKFDGENIGQDETGKHHLSYDAVNLYRVPSEVSTGGAVQFMGSGVNWGWQEDLYTSDNFTQFYRNFTISCQLKLYKFFGETGLPIVSTGCYNRGGFTLGLKESNGQSILFFDGRDTVGNAVYYAAPITDEILNVWHSYSLVVSHGGHMISLYCDAEKIGETLLENALQMEHTEENCQDNNVVIGNCWWRSVDATKLTGELDNLYFYNKTLSEEKLATIANMETPVYRGDCNEDGIIDIRDYVNFKRSFVDNAEYSSRFDCTRDFVVDNQDRALLLKYLLGGATMFNYYDTEGFGVASTFSNHMVLQRNKQVRIYGTGGTIGSQVMVTFGDQTKTAIVEPDGWEVLLDPMEASTVGRKLTVKNGLDEISFYDVVVGDVFLCGGQSNMNVTYNYLYKRDKSIADDYNSYDNFANLRAKIVSEVSAMEPKMYTGRRDVWNTCMDLTSAGNISAVALSYALNLSEMLGDDIPIGLITCSVGGTSIETWLSEENMEGLTSYFGKDSIHYNGMLHSVLGYTAKGFLWYQGCTDSQSSGMVSEYGTKFSRLVSMIRSENKDENLPIITHQLVQFKDFATWTDIRQTQYEMAREIENVYMVCGIDTGCNVETYAEGSSIEGIHPTDKWVLGERGAGIAISEIYKKDYDSVKMACYGDTPYISAAHKTEKGIELTVTNATALHSKEVDLGYDSTLVNKEGKIGYFEVYDGTAWTEVNAILDGATIVLDTDIENITAVRYLQDDVFADGNSFIYNEYGNVLAPLYSMTVDTN